MIIYAVVEYVDEGCYTDRVYDLFFTTKEKAEQRMKKLIKNNPRGDYGTIEVEVGE